MNVLDQAAGGGLIFSCGDSFISTHRPPICGPQIQSWPARLTGYRVVNVASRGATTENLGWLDAGKLVGNPQHRGGQLQLADPALLQADLVLITIGGNDAGVKWLLKHTTRWSGRGHATESQIRERILGTQNNITRVLLSLRDLAPQAAVVVVGYPHVFPTNHELEHAWWLTPWQPADQQLVNRASDLMNHVLATAAARTGATMLDPRPHFVDHQACGYRKEYTRGPVPGWFPGVHGSSFHMTDYGCDALAAFAQNPIDALLRHAQPTPLYRCLDCNVDTHSIGEYYMVWDHVWSQTGLGTHSGMLCVGCLENRIGRRLAPTDFSDAPINHVGGIRRSTRLRSRLRSPLRFWNRRLSRR